MVSTGGWSLSIIILVAHCQYTHSLAVKGDENNNLLEDFIAYFSHSLHLIHSSFIQHFSISPRSSPSGSSREPLFIAPFSLTRKGAGLTASQKYSTILYWPFQVRFSAQDATFHLHCQYPRCKKSWSTKLLSWLDGVTRPLYGFEIVGFPASAFYMWFRHSLWVNKNAPHLVRASAASRPRRTILSSTNKL